MKYLAIDYGDKRVGVAASDSGIIANAVYTFSPKSMREAIDRVCEEARKRSVDVIVIGLPLNMDGTEGERASKTRSFGKVVQRVSGVTVEYQDERLTSVEAENILIEGGVRRDKRKQLIDQISAQIILQSFLDNRNK